MQRKTASGHLLQPKNALHDGGRPVTQEVNVLALVKGAERFIYVYDDDSRASTLDAIRDAAADPAMGLNWFDAAVLTERARQQATSSQSGTDSEVLPSRIRDVLPG